MGALGLKEYPKLFKQSVKEFFQDDPLKYSAALAYYTIFALPGILILTLHILSLFMGEDAVTGQLKTQVEGLVGSGAAEQIQNIMENATKNDSGVFMRMVGIAALLFSATTAFMALQDALNAMWSVKAKPEKGWLHLILSRLLSLAMMATVGFLLLVSLVLEAMISVVKDGIESFLPSLSFEVVYILNLGISLLVITTMFAIIFKVLPDAKVRWKNVWFGAIFTTVLFVLGKFMIGFYLGNADFSSTYGAAGSLIVILVWVYYSSLILLFGAEITQVYSMLTESRIEPANHAVRVKWDEVELND